jgi:hypothetical protein
VGRGGEPHAGLEVMDVPGDGVDEFYGVGGSEDQLPMPLGDHLG